MSQQNGTKWNFIVNSISMSQSAEDHSNDSAPRNSSLAIVPRRVPGEECRQQYYR
jgi:hypothetical protein